MPVTMLRDAILAGQRYKPGEVVPDDVWDGLRKRTRTVLLNGRFAAERMPPKKTAAKPPKGG